MAAAGYLINANEMPRQHNLQISAQWKFKPLPNVAQTYWISLSYQHAHCTPFKSTNTSKKYAITFIHLVNLKNTTFPTLPHKEQQIQWEKVPKTIFCWAFTSSVNLNKGNYFTACKPSLECFCTVVHLSKTEGRLICIVTCQHKISLHHHLST